MKPLYKFVGHREAVCSIARGLIKFTKISELNDPSELAPLMHSDAVCDSLAAVRRNGYTDEQFAWLGYQEAVLRLLSLETRILSRPATKELANRTLTSPVYDYLEFMEQQLLRTINLIRSRVGIFSLLQSGLIHSQCGLITVPKASGMSCALKPSTRNFLVMKPAVLTP